MTRTVKGNRYVFSQGATVRSIGRFVVVEHADGKVAAVIGDVWADDGGGGWWYAMPGETAARLSRSPARWIALERLGTMFAKRVGATLGMLNGRNG